MSKFHHRGFKDEAAKKTFYRSVSWKKLRLLALDRDNYECQECKRQGRVTVDSTKTEGERKTIKLNVHHIKEIEFHPELALELDNLETVCLYHHNVEHGRIFKTKENLWPDEKW